MLNRPRIHLDGVNMLNYTKQVEPDNRLKLERVRIFFGLATGNMPSIVLGALLIATVLHNSGVPLVVNCIWLMLLIMFSVMAVAYERHVQKIGVSTDNADILLRKRMVLGGVVSALYGVSGFLLPIESSPAQDALLFLILFTVITLASLSYAVMPSYFLFLDVLCLFPITAHIAIQSWKYQDEHYLYLLVLSIIIQFLVLKKALQASQTAIGAIVLNLRLNDEIAEHEKTKEAMHHIALHDPVTGMGNRRYFEEESVRTISTATREGTQFGLLAIDLNGFKAVNDTHGHAMGDALLKAVGDRMVKAVRASDFCARIGGDEFSVIVKNISSISDAIEIADKLRARLAEPFDIEGIRITIGASIGCAAYPDDGTTMDCLMVDADAKMYLEKKAGKLGR